MSGAAQPATVSAPAPTLMRSLSVLFHVLDPLSDDNRLVVRTNFDQAVLQIRGADVYDHALPPALLELLEAHNGQGRVSLAALGSVPRLSAVAVWFRVDQVYRNSQGERGGPGSQHVWPVERLAAACARAEAFALAMPAVIVAGGGELVAVFALDGPMRLRHARDEARVLALMRRMAEVLEGDPIPLNATIADLSVPIPGLRPGLGSYTPRDTERTLALVARDDQRFTIPQLTHCADLVSTAPPTRPRAGKAKEPRR